MTNAEFIALVARLEGDARRDPGGYRLRTAALALVGYAYLGLVIALLVMLLLVALVSVIYLKAAGVKLAIAIAIFLAVVVRATWIRLSAPQGIEIDARSAPELFAAIQRLRKSLGAPRFHHVLVTNDFNASVVQVPRLGLFGWHRNYLTIGLPLMKCLTRPQFEAVLAHEFGHLAGGHARFSNWIYRLRLSWYRLLAVLEAQESFGRFLFKPFFARYAPYFNAYSFPLARANEYEADAAAARLTSSQAAAQALTSVAIGGTFLDERYWPEIHRKANDLPQPAFAPFSSMGERFCAGLAEGDVKTWLERAMAEETSVANTHPSLADRLKALHESPRHVPPAPGEAADALLGAALPAITAQFDSSWKQAIAPSWEERHRAVQQGRARLAILEERAPAQLPVDELLERAQLAEDIGAGPDAALDLYRLARERAPDLAIANLLLGVRLLGRGDDAGFAMVERSISLDDSLTAAGARVLRDACWARGRKDEAHAWNAKLGEALALDEGMRKERSQVRAGDKLDAHGLDAAAVERIRERLRAIPRIRRAYLARKRLQHKPERPLYVLGFKVTPAWRYIDRKAAAAAQAAILKTVALPGDGIVFCLDGENASFARKFKRAWRIL
jgi:Zn-dependent protease with chaperone function